LVECPEKRVLVEYPAEREVSPAQMKSVG